MVAELNAPLKVDVAQQPAGVVVTLAGSADIGSSELLRQRLVEAAEASSVVVVDMHELSFICSTGLGALIEAHKICRAAGVRLRLVDPIPPVRKVLETMRLDKIIGLFDTLDEALETPV